MPSRRSAQNASDSVRAVNRRPQMADIARLAGISIGSVSRALSGSKEVSEATRSRVLELARSLNYAVNAGASNLRRGHSQTVSVVSPLLGDDNQHLTDPFLWAVVGAIAERLTARGFRMLLTRLAADDVNVTADVESGAADAMIFTGQWLPHQRLNEMALAGVPFAVWGAEQPRQLYSSVGTDNRAGARMAVEHLLSQGVSTIMFVGDSGSLEVRERHQGYLDAHASRGLVAPAHLLLPFMFDPARLRAELRQWLSRGVSFDGAFAASDMAAIAVMQELDANGLKAGQDVLIVGYDDVPAAGIVTPALTTVRQSIPHAAAGLVDGVLSQLEGHQPTNVLVPSELIVRKSSVR